MGHKCGVRIPRCFTQRSIDDSIGAGGLAKTFHDVPSKFHVSGCKLWSRLGTPRRLGSTAGWVGTWDNLPLQPESTSWNSPESFIRFTLSCNSCIWEATSLIVDWLSLNPLPGEFVNSHFWSSFQFFYVRNTSTMSFSKCSFSLR